MSSEKKLLGPSTIIGSSAKWGNSGVAGDMSQAVITSKEMKIRNIDNVCIEVAWSNGSTPQGAFTLEGSLTGENWSLVQFSLPSPGGDNVGSFLLDLNQLSFPLMRLIYTKASGGGDLVAYVGGKEI